MLDFLTWLAQFGRVLLTELAILNLTGWRMSDYHRYKQCMDEARKLTQEASDLMGHTGSESDRKRKCTQLLKKATLLRRLAMQYAFDSVPAASSQSADRTDEYNRLSATTENGHKIRL